MRDITITAKYYGSELNIELKSLDDKIKDLNLKYNPLFKQYSCKCNCTHQASLPNRFVAEQPREIIYHVKIDTHCTRFIRVGERANPSEELTKRLMKGDFSASDKILPVTFELARKDSDGYPIDHLIEYSGPQYGHPLVELVNEAYELSKKTDDIPEFALATIPRKEVSNAEISEYYHLVLGAEKGRFFGPIINGGFFTKDEGYLRSMTLLVASLAKQKGIKLSDF